MTQDIWLGASEQWATRPADERFTDRHEMEAIAKAQYDASRETPAGGVKLATLELGYDDKAVYLATPRGRMNFTHYSFNQFATRANAGAAVEVFRSSPPELVAPLLNHRLKQADQNQNPSQLLYVPPTDEGDPGLLRAVTGKRYERIWNYEVLSALNLIFDEGGFEIPYASYKDADPNRASTWYMSDHDIWMLGVLGDRYIDDGAGPIKKGIVVKNSEVGGVQGGAFKAFDFGYATICDNRIVWGFRKGQELRIPHFEGAQEDFVKVAIPYFKKFAEQSMAEEQSLIDAAKKRSIGKNADEVIATVYEKVDIAQKVTKEALQLVAAGQAGAPSSDITNQYNVVAGITAAARTITYNDRRVALETAAGKLLTLERF